MSVALPELTSQVRMTDKKPREACTQDFISLGPRQLPNSTMQSHALKIMLCKFTFMYAQCMHRCSAVWTWWSSTPTQYVVNTLYWPHTALSVYLVCYFLVPHTHVLCMGSGSATGKKIQVRLVHSLLKYFFKFQLWYWIKNLHYQIFKFVIDNSDISLNCLQHIQKRRNFDAKVTCHQPICLLLHAILSGVGVVKQQQWSHVASASQRDKINLFAIILNCEHKFHTYPNAPDNIRIIPK